MPQSDRKCNDLPLVLAASTRHGNAENPLSVLSVAENSFIPYLLQSPDSVWLRTRFRLPFITFKLPLLLALATFLDNPAHVSDTSAITSDYNANSTVADVNHGSPTTHLHLEPGAALTGHGTLDTELRNDGTLTATGPLHITGPVTNNGLLDLLTSTSPLPADLTNTGVIITPNDLTITSITVTGTTVTVTAPTFANHTYTLEHAPDATSWLPVTPPIQGNNTDRTFTHTTPAPQGYYRLTVR